MVLLFEDNVNTPSSRLLRSCHYGDSVHFANGNYNLAKEAERLSDLGHSVVVFIDLSVNRTETVMIYNSLSKKFKSSKSILVLPIICIEFYLLKMLYNHGFLSTAEFKCKEVVDVQDLLHNFVTDITGYSIECSLEKQYKYILDEVGHLKHCYINKSKKGKFYVQGCQCDNTYCKSFKQASLMKKAECFYTTLPVFFMAPDYKKYIEELGININIEKASLVDIYNNLVSLHIKLCSLYGSDEPIFRFNKNFVLA